MSRDAFTRADIFSEFETVYLGENAKNLYFR